MKNYQKEISKVNKENVPRKKLLSYGIALIIGIILWVMISGIVFNIKGCVDRLDAAEMDVLQPYHETYIITGKDKNNQTILQFSMKWPIFRPFESGVFLGYTQKCDWRIYDHSSPFEATIYNPSLFWEKENIWILDFLRIIPYEHKSNGRDGEASKSIDYYYIESQISFGKKFNFGASEKIGAYYTDRDDLHHDYGNFKTKLFFQIKDNYALFSNFKIYIEGEWMHNRLNTKYWFEAGASINITFGYSQFSICYKHYQGPGMFLGYPYRKYDGIGLALNI